MLLMPLVARRIAYALLVSSLAMSSLVSFATPNSENTLSISNAFEFNSIDPSKYGHVYTRMQILETLLNVDEKGNLVAALAKSWQVMDEAKRWRLTLRENVRFHDGTIMDAEAVVNSLNIAREKHGVLRKAPVKSIKVIDTNTVEITLTRPYVILGAVLAHYSTGILEPGSYNQEGEVIVLSGTGPYQLYQYAPPHKLVVKKFDNYWGKKASIPYASYLTGHRAESRTMQARSGQADIVFGLNPASLPLLKRLPTLTVHSNPIPRTIALKLNSTHEFLKEIEARQALSFAINRSGIAKGVLRIPGAQAEQLLPASMADWYLTDVSESADLLAQAEKLLASIGWKKNAQGMLEREGKEFELTLITYADRPELTVVATALQDQWKALGVKLTINITNSSAIPAGHHDGSLEVALMARNYGFIANPLGVILSDFNQSGGGDWGAMNWYNDDMQGLLNKLEQTTDTKAFHRLAQQAARLIYQERPMIPVSYYVQQTAVNKRVKGFRFDPFERSFFLNEMEFVK